MVRRHDRPTTMHTRRWIFGLMVLLLISPWARGEEPPPQESSPFSQAKYVPDISLILDCSYLMRSLPDECYEELTVPGTAIPLEHETSHRGFNLNYAEITFYSIVDPYFELFAVLHVSEHHLHLEEAYFLTKKLPAGLQLKGGKFRSGFGRINEQHAHYWDFANPPLIVEALFGPEGLNEVGARVSWVAPLETYLMLSGELLMGENEASFGRTGIHSATASFNEGSVNGPGLWVAYGKTSFDVGDASVLLGASAGRGTTRLDEGFSASLAGGRHSRATRSSAGATSRSDTSSMRSGTSPFRVNSSTGPPTRHAMPTTRRQRCAPPPLRGVSRDSTSRRWQNWGCSGGPACGSTCSGRIQSSRRVSGGTFPGTCPESLRWSSSIRPNSRACGFSTTLIDPGTLWSISP